jgi:hypothetical protein
MITVGTMDARGGGGHGGGGRGGGFHSGGFRGGSHGAAAYHGVRGHGSYRGYGHRGGYGHHKYGYGYGRYGGYGRRGYGYRGFGYGLGWGLGLGYLGAWALGSPWPYGGYWWNYAPYYWREIPYYGRNYPLEIVIEDDDYWVFTNATNYTIIIGSYDGVVRGKLRPGQTVTIPRRGDDRFVLSSRGSKAQVYRSDPKDIEVSITDDMLE